MHTKRIKFSGKRLEEAEKAVIMLHGRGASAEDILSLSGHLNIKKYALIAPQATNATWYPKSFLAPRAENEPWLTSALALLQEIIADINKAGIPSSSIYFVGFSQGACLTLEFIARHAMKWGGAVAFTGGLIGTQVNKDDYQGSFAGTPVFVGTSDPDPHVPVERVRSSVKILDAMGALVTEKIYPGMGHTVSTEELSEANKLIFV